jgi:hypothetical protein
VSYSIDLDVASALATPRTCPACGAGDLSTIPGADGVSFRCPRCGGSWAPEMGTLVPVEPVEPLEPLEMAGRDADDRSPGTTGPHPRPT